MRKLNLMFSIASSMIALAFLITQCVPVKSNSNVSSEPTSKVDATSKEVSIHIVKEDPTKKGRYLIEFSTEKEVEKFAGTKVKIASLNFCQEVDDGNNCHAMAPSKKAAPNKNRQLFETSSSVALTPGAKYTIIAGDADGASVYKSSRVVYFKKKKNENASSQVKWEKVKTILVDSCAGADCHHNTAGGAFTTVEQNNWYLVDEAEFGKHKDVLKKRLSDKTMPPQDSPAMELRDTERKLLLDYIANLK